MKRALGRGLFLIGVVPAFLAVAPAARADEPAAGDPEPADPAPAASSPAADPDAAVASALKDLAAKKYDRACPALRESYRQDRRPDLLFHVARCEDERGRIATALAAYDDYLALFDKLSPSEQREEADREEQASARREALARVLPKVTLKLPDDAPPGTKITRRSADGVAVPLALNVPLPVDPGEVVVRVETPGRPDWDHRFTIDRGEQKTVEVPVPPADKRVAARVERAVVKPVPPYLPALGSDSQGQRIAAYVTAGVGIAGIAAGAISGMYTLSQKSGIEDNCHDKLCNRIGEEAKDTAATTGTVSTVTFAVGGAALAAGVVLYLTAPAPARLSLVPSRVVARPSGVEAMWQW